MTELSIVSAADQNDAHQDDDAEAHDGHWEGMPISEVIQQIHARQVDANDLPNDVRQQCVGHLTLEGFTNSEIAQLMRICERTVTRDRNAVRHAGALVPDRTLGDQLLGELERICMSSVQRLTRLAQDTNNPPYARLWSEEAIVRIHQRLIDTAHRLHYFEDGKARLQHERDTDPAEHERSRQRTRAMLERVRGI